MRARYGMRAFLKDRVVLLALAVVCLALLFAGCLILGLSIDAAAALAALVAVVLIAMLAYSYVRRMRFYAEVETLATEIEHGYQLPSLVSRPEFLDGKIAYDLAESIAVADAEDLTGERQAAAQSREYVELWTHEVKTPIAASKLILGRLHGDDAMALRREIERIETACERALYSSRVTNLSSDYVIKEMSLVSACREACKELSHLLIEEHVSPEIDIDPSLTVLADSHWVKFVVKQVVSNSAKYGANTVRFNVVEGDVEERGRCTKLLIEDDGLGIPSKEIANVFKLGYSGSNGRADGASTGMGLYLSAQACRRMGLGLTISSERDEGTCVELIFPHDRSRAELTRV